MRARSNVSDVSERIRIGASAGFTLRYVGLFGRLAGNWLRAALMAACTSRAAPSMLRLRSNWRTMLVDPNWLVDVIWLMPAIRPNWRSRGVATADAMVVGFAPGSPAETEITGNSTCGSGATGRRLKARMPESSSAAASSEVPIGRLINGAEIFMTSRPRTVPRSGCRFGSAQTCVPTGQTTGTPPASYKGSAVDSAEDRPQL